MGANSNKVFRLEGKVQHYDWGGFFYLSDLLGKENGDNRPYAEYWMGAHGRSSATLYIPSEKHLQLDQYIKENPAETIGQRVHGRFGRLPYLLKVLDVKNMLSIQVHPTKSEAERGFEAENAAGVSVHDHHRNYKDDNHKPELMLALSDFWLLHGFKTAEQLLKTLDEVPELTPLKTEFVPDRYENLYRHVMQMPGKQVETLLRPLIDRVVPLYEQGKLSRSSADFWAARAALTYTSQPSPDRGIFSIYFFNLVQLKPQQAVFQDAGLPHAYLEGQNIEIMANSDNVLRGGLTPKHIDVAELIKHIRFEPTIPRLIEGDRVNNSETVYPTPAPDFELSMIRLSEETSYDLKSVTTDIFLVMEGVVSVGENEHNHFQRKKGEAFVSFHGAAFTLSAETDAAVCCRATVPSAGLS